MTKARSILIPQPTVIAVATALLAASAPAYATSRLQTATQDEQRVIDDIVYADTALLHGQRSVARSDVGQAETVLLNAQQADGYRDPQSLAALIRAHTDLLNGKTQGARKALSTAENDLFTPRAG